MATLPTHEHEEPARDLQSLSFWHIAERDPNRVALIDALDREITYGELLANVNQLSRAFVEFGLERGDGIAVVLPNCREYFECLFAALQSGVYITPVNCHLAAAEIAYVIVDSEAKLLVAHQDYADACLVGARDAGLRGDRCLAVGVIPGFASFETVKQGKLTSSPLRTAGSVMTYTSGTTGKPKGVRTPLRDTDPATTAGEIAALTLEGFGVDIDQGVHLVCGPLYHAGPSLMANSTLHAGHTLVLMDRWAPEACVELIQRHRVTSSQMVPTMFHRLLSLPEDTRQRYDVSSVQSIMHTGAPCPVEVKQRFMDWFGPVLFETYGGTDAGAATIAKPHRWLAKPGTVGRVINGVSVKIFDDDGNECPVGVPGSIFIGSRGPAREYFKDPEKTASNRRGNLVSIGDIGYFDSDGFLFLCDRKIDMIISGGVNIYPAEVEAALLGHPAVADVGVIGIPDAEWGEQVMAIVELAPGHDPSVEFEQVLIDFCRARIAHFKCPRTIAFVEELPRLPNGKLHKRSLRERYQADREVAT